MISKDSINTLLQKPNNIVMIHGTSIESIIELLQTGKLRSSFYPNYKDHPSYQGYLFFIPQKSSFSNHPLYNKIKTDLTLNEMIFQASDYSHSTQAIRFLIDTFGYWPPNCSCDEFEPYGFWTMEQLRHAGVNTPLMEKYGIDELYYDLKKRRGVCIGVNNNIFELDIEDGCDDPGEEVMIHLPKGLDIKYVNYIKPLGELENIALKNYIKTIL